MEEPPDGPAAALVGSPDPMQAQAVAAEAIRAQMEEYVRGRIRAFAHDFAKEAAPDLTAQQIDDITLRVLSGGGGGGGGGGAGAASGSGSAGGGGGGGVGSPLPPLGLVAAPAGAAAAPVAGQYRLQFRHECTALGCRDTECLLCAFNPNRVCERNFLKKYLVGDVLRAKCGAAIRVEVLDSKGAPVVTGGDGQPDFTVELTLLDGVGYKDKGGEGRLLTADELRSCFELNNHKGEPLLAYKNATAIGGSGVAVNAAGSGKAAAAGATTSGGGAVGSGGGGERRPGVQLWLEGGSAALPDLTVTDSSEALLQGRRPPFRLVAWVAGPTGAVNPAVQYCVSEDFVVATRRVKQANKADIPLVDDPVSKIEHIGRETVKKLMDMRAAALETNQEITIDDRMARIETVGQFQNLVHCVEADPQLRKVVQNILKLSKEKWDEAARHACEAVRPDFRRRVWYPQGHMGLGLVFGCKLGAVQLRDSIALVQTMGDGAVKVTEEDQLDPASLEILRDLKITAVKKWSEARHPGWGIFREPADGTDGRPGLSVGGGISVGAATPMVGSKRTAAAAGLDDGNGGGAGSGGGTLSAAAAAAQMVALGGLGTAGMLAPLSLASLTADGAGLSTLGPEALAALQAQLGMSALAAGLAAPAADAAAAAAAATPPPGSAVAAAPAGVADLAGGGLGGLDLQAAALAGISPQLLSALQAQMAAGAPDFATAVSNLFAATTAAAAAAGGGGDAAAAPFAWPAAADGAGGSGGGGGDGGAAADAAGGSGSGGGGDGGGGNAATGQRQLGDLQVPPLNGLMPPAAGAGSAGGAAAGVMGAMAAAAAAAAAGVGA